MSGDPDKTTGSVQSHPSWLAMSRLPRNVCIALVLIGVVFLVEAYNVFRMLEAGWFPVGLRPLVIPGAQCILLPLICYQIVNRRRWARTLLLVLTLTAFAWFCRNIAFVVLNEPEMWTALLDPIYLVRHELPIFLAFAALYLLYFASGDFFGTRRPPDR